METPRPAAVVARSSQKGSEVGSTGLVRTWKRRKTHAGQAGHRGQRADHATAAAGVAPGAAPAATSGDHGQHQRSGLPLPGVAA